MKTSKMNLSNINDELSRDEMKMIMAGSGCSGNNECSADCPCSSSADWCDNGLCKAKPY